MAMLQVAPQLLLDSLFKGAADGVSIMGASFDPVSQVVLLDIVGLDVPDAARVNAICTIERFSVKFEPVAEVSS